MTAFRIYRLYRRAGNSPCTAYKLAQRAQPGVLASAACYATAAGIATCAALLIVLR